MSAVKESVSLLVFIQRLLQAAQNTADDSDVKELIVKILNTLINHDADFLQEIEVSGDIEGAENYQRYYETIEDERRSKVDIERYETAIRSILNGVHDFRVFYSEIDPHEQYDAAFSGPGRWRHGASIGAMEISAKKYDWAKEIYEEFRNQARIEIFQLPYDEVSISRKTVNVHKRSIQYSKDLQTDTTDARHNAVSVLIKLIQFFIHWTYAQQMYLRNAFFDYYQTSNAYDQAAVITCGELKKRDTMYDIPFSDLAAFVAQNFDNNSLDLCYRSGRDKVYEEAFRQLQGKK